MVDTIKSNQFIQHGLHGLCGELEDFFGGKVIFLMSDIDFGVDDSIRDAIEKIVENTKPKPRGRLPKLIVFLQTSGGFVEVVERISNVFRKHFVEVEFVIPNFAYSAGTVLALSGDAIHMDYYSILGPIDPQIQNEQGRFIPGMGYLYKYEKLVKKSKEGKITDAELLFLTKRFDPAVMYVIEQAKNHSEELIKEWLVKYKFKNWEVTQTKKMPVTLKMKKERAAQIAEALGDAEKWHSHGRGINLRDFRRKSINLLIDDFGKDKNISHLIHQYYDLYLDYCRKMGINGAIHSMDGLTRLA